MKKIAIIMPHVTGKGGTENVVRTVMKLLQQKNSKFYPKLYILGGSEDKEWLKDLNYSETVFSRNRLIRNILNFFFIFIYLKKFIQKEQPDIIITTHSIMCFLINLIRKMTNKKYPIVSWIHFSLNAKNVKRKLLHFADFHLAICPSIKKEFESLRITNSKVYIIYNPIYFTNNTVSRPKEKAHFLYVGRVIYEGQKRIKDLLTALSKVNGEWQLDIIGDGKDLVLCKEYAKQLNIEKKIIWHGWMPNPWNSIDKASALVLTSSFEGFGMVLAEAISHGIYCISSNCNVGPSDIIKENMNGELFETGNIMELKRILQSIINGKSLPDQQIIKSSIENLYVDQYQSTLASALEDIYNSTQYNN